MLRLQSSWLLETAAEVVQVDSIFVPYFYRFSALNWLNNLELPITVNFPIDSQAMIAKAWFEADRGPFLARNFSRFIQPMSEPLPESENPFNPWLGTLFDRQQLDYLYYWREKTQEIKDTAQKEIFWSVIYQVISYWLSNKKAETSMFFEPDKIVAYYLHYRNDFIKDKGNKVEITNYHINELKPENASLTLFPLLFDEENEEDLLQIIYYCWCHGHANLKLARKEIDFALNKYMVPFNAKNDYSLFVNLAKNSSVAAFTWSGKGLAPKVYEQVLVEPIRKAFANTHSNSKLSLKSVDKTTDSYDYLLVLGQA
jgi:hypothetical protein